MADFYKDPDDVLDYGRDWSDALETDETVVDSTWFISGKDAALTAVSGSSAFAGQQTVIWLQAGTAGALYTLTNKITTSSTPIARVLERSFTILVKER